MRLLQTAASRPERVFRDLSMTSGPPRIYCIFKPLHGGYGGFVVFHHFPEENSNETSISISFSRSILKVLRGDAVMSTSNGDPALPHVFLVTAATPPCVTTAL